MDFTGILLGVLAALVAFVSGFLSVHFLKGGRWRASRKESWHAGYQAGWEDAGNKVGKTNCKTSQSADGNDTTSARVATA